MKTAMDKMRPRTKKEKTDRKKYNIKRSKRLKEHIEKLNEQTRKQNEELEPTTKIRKRKKNETTKSTDMG